MINKIFVTTSDGVQIVGSYVLPEDDIAGAALLLHMMPSTKESFVGMQQDLSLRGIASLAIDLRGHGESLRQNGMPDLLDYRLFSDQQHQASILDAKSALDYLLHLATVIPDHAVLIGASIGANIALQLLTEQHAVPHAVLLSPGINYRGIETLPLIKKIGPKQTVTLVATPGDTDSYASIQRLHAELPSRTEIIETKGSAHGTDMFQDGALYASVLEKVCLKATQYGN